MAALAVGIAAGVAYVGCVLCCKGIIKCRLHKEGMLLALIVFLFIILILFSVNIYIQWKIKKKERLLNNLRYRLQYYQSRMVYGISHQQDDIYNISGRVQGQDQWPTHDAYLSIDHINTANQLNKPNYTDAPPSYEEAMRIEASNSTGGSTVPTVVVVPKTTD